MIDDTAGQILAASAEVQKLGVLLAAMQFAVDMHDEPNAQEKCENLLAVALQQLRAQLDIVRGIYSQDVSAKLRVAAFPRQSSEHDRIVADANGAIGAAIALSPAPPRGRRKRSAAAFKRIIQGWRRVLRSTVDTKVIAAERDRAVAMLAPAAPHATDDSAFVPASSLYPDKFDNYPKFKRWLDSVPETVVRRKSPSPRRLVIHSGDWLKYWKEQDRQTSEALDSDGIQEFIADAASRAAEMSAEKRNRRK